MMDRPHFAVTQNEEKIWVELQDIDIPMLEVPVPESPVIMQSASCGGGNAETSPTLSPCSPLVDTGWENPDSMNLFSILDDSFSHDEQEHVPTDIEENVFPINNLLFDEQTHKVVDHDAYVKDAESYTMPADSSSAVILNEINACQQYGRGKTQSIRNCFADTLQDGAPCEVSFTGNEGACLNEVKNLKTEAPMPADMVIDQNEPSFIATPSEIQVRKNRQRLARKRRMENQARKHWPRFSHGSAPAKASCSSSSYMCTSPTHSEVVNPDLPISLQSSTPICQDEMVLVSLQNCIQKFSWETRICIRDSLYRLAQSAKERQNGAQKNNCSNIWETESRSSKETATNSFDRMVARLLFCKPDHGLKTGGFSVDHAYAVEVEGSQTSTTRTTPQLHASCGSSINQQDQPAQMIMGL